MLIGRKVEIPTGGAAVQLVDADDFEGEFEVVVRSGHVYLGDSTVAVNNGYLMDTNNTPALTLRLGGGDSLYGAVDSGAATVVYVLAYSV